MKPLPLPDGRRFWALGPAAPAEPSQQTMAGLAKLQAAGVAFAYDGYDTFMVTMTVPAGWKTDDTAAAVEARLGEIVEALRQQSRAREARGELRVFG